MDRSSAQNESPETLSEKRVRQNHLDGPDVSRPASRREWLEAQARANAAEDTDPTPIEVPPFYTRPPTLREDLQRYVRYEVSRAAHDSGYETFEEADDFGIEDDDDLDDWDSEYQLTPLQEEETMTSEYTDGVDDDVKPKREEVRENGESVGDVSAVEREAGRSGEAAQNDEARAVVSGDGAS